MSDIETDENSAMPDKRDPAVRTAIAQHFVEAIPHNRAIGLCLVDADETVVRTRLDYRPEFLGDVEAGLWHTGIATTAADSTCGLAVFLALPGFEAIATLDLRMDYWRPATAGKSLWITARCEHVTEQMAFVTASLDQGEPDRPTARATATFTRTHRSLTS